MARCATPDVGRPVIVYSLHPAEIADICDFLINIQFPKGEVVPATRLRRARPTWTFHTWLPNSPRSVMKIKNMLRGNYSQHHVVYI
jgi:hypothetical protein